MTQPGTRLFPIAVIGLLAGLTFWLDRATQVELGRSGTQRHDPDYIVDRFEVRRFAADGALQNTLVAQKMLHYPDDDSTEVVAPDLTYHRTPPTRVVAQRAWLDKDGKHVRLEGDVRVTRAGFEDRPPTTVSTSVLYAVPDDEYARTDAPTTISEGQTVIKGSGFESNNKSRLSVLNGRAEGIIYKRQTEGSGKP